MKIIRSCEKEKYTENKRLILLKDLKKKIESKKDNKLERERKENRQIKKG